MSCGANTILVQKENVGFYVINKDTRLAYQSALVAEAGLLSKIAENGLVFT